MKFIVRRGDFWAQIEYFRNMDGTLNLLISCRGVPYILIGCDGQCRGVVWIVFAGIDVGISGYVDGETLVFTCANRDRLGAIKRERHPCGDFIGQFQLDLAHPGVLNISNNFAFDVPIVFHGDSKVTAHFFINNYEVISNSEAVLVTGKLFIFSFFNGCDTITFNITIHLTFDIGPYIRR